MKPLMYILGSVIIIFMLPAALLSFTDFRSGDYEEPHNVDTGVGETTADIVLTQDLFDEDRSYVTITSNLTADAPVPSAYVDSTRTLTVSGLQASDSRRLTVDYKVSKLSSYWAADLGTRTVPLFIILGIIGIIAGAVYLAATSRSE